MSYFYLSIIAIQSNPIDIGLDQYHRSVMSLNFRCVARHPINLESNIADLIHNSSPQIAAKGVDLFYGSSRTLSENPEVLIISTGGFDSKIPHGSSNNHGKILIRPTFQVLTYDMDHDLAMERSLAILNLLNGLSNVTVP